MLKQRIWTAIIGLFLIISVLLWSPVSWHLFVTVATVIGVSEFAAMFGYRWSSIPNVWSCLIVIFIEWFPLWSQPIWIELLIASALMLPVITKNQYTLRESATIFIGAMYIGYGGDSLSRLRVFPHGLEWIWLCLISIWMTDTVAFFVGRAVKGPKLWPSISPKKTLSGAIGGIFGASLGAIVFGYFAVPGFDPLSYGVVGAVISIAGQAGDFIESAYKRSTGVKDSGKILPGHGGILDRVDSLLFAAPFVLYLVSTGATSWFQ